MAQGWAAPPFSHGIPVLHNSCANAPDSLRFRFNQETQVFRRPSTSAQGTDMRVHPALRHAVSIFCLFLVAAAGVAFGATPPTRTHRSRGLSAWADPAKGDVVEYDDAVVRQIAVDALGHSNGAVLAMDPSPGRILAIVNQKMAFSAGFEPCSTIKPVIALAGLQEGVIPRDTMMRVGHRRYMDLTEAMAHSNNIYFEEVGTRLGFPRVHKYAHLLGLGQKAGYNIEEEQAGTLPAAPPAYGGVARMSSFGEGLR